MRPANSAAVTGRLPIQGGRGVGGGLLQGRGGRRRWTQELGFEPPGLVGRPYGRPSGGQRAVNSSLDPRLDSIGLDEPLDLDRLDQDPPAEPDVSKTAL